MVFRIARRTTGAVGSPPQKTTNVFESPARPQRFVPDLWKSSFNLGNGISTSGNGLLTVGSHISSPGNDVSGDTAHISALGDDF